MCAFLRITVSTYNGHILLRLLEGPPYARHYVLGPRPSLGDEKCGSAEALKEFGKDLDKTEELLAVVMSIGVAEKHVVYDVANAELNEQTRSFPST